MNREHPSEGDLPPDPVDPLASARRPPDPLGRRALFWASGEPAAGEPEHRRIRALPLGKRALFSAAHASDDVPGAQTSENPLTERGPLVVGCSKCGSVARIGLVDFVFLQFPVGFWFPRGRFGHRMTCPHCRRRVWASVTIRRGGGADLTPGR